MLRLGHLRVGLWEVLNKKWNKLTWHLKMDGGNKIVSFWVSANFQGRLLLVSGRVGGRSFPYQLQGRCGISIPFFLFAM